MAKAPAKRPIAKDGETHEFVARHTIIRPEKTYEPGESVPLNANDFVELKTAEAIDGEWPETEEQKPS